MPSDQGRAVPPNTSQPATARRVVLLVEGDDSPAAEILAEFEGSDAANVDLGQQVQQHAERHPGRCVAAEWHGQRGWVRFLFCRH